MCQRVGASVSVCHYNSTTLPDHFKLTDIPKLFNCILYPICCIQHRYGFYSIICKNMLHTLRFAKFPNNSYSSVITTDDNSKNGLYFSEVPLRVKTRSTKRKRKSAACFAVPVETFVK